MRLGVITAGFLLALAGCGDAQDAAEDKMERTAEAQATEAGAAQAALGLTELQLLDADLIGPNNVELGDVARVDRDAAGKVDRLLIEIEDSNPDRFVQIPVDGLKPVIRGKNTDLQTTRTAAELQALPEVKLAP